ncbi:MAG: cytochrome c oxidase subunit 4 [Actinomycetota bacterium]|nr:cytochrome c oxidase subunit 4 [Actinomycetota bacterium]
MKVESKIFLALVIFFVPVGLIYGFWTHWTELVGPFGLFLTAALSGLIAFYLSVTGRSVGLRPEDNPNALISEQEGDYGFFTPYSWWPLWLGLTAALMFAGLAVGWWLFIIGAFFAIVAIVGWTFEHYKGEYAN